MKEPLAAYADAQRITLPNATVRLHRARKALQTATHRNLRCLLPLHACLNCTCVA